MATHQKFHAISPVIITFWVGIAQDCKICQYAHLSLLSELFVWESGEKGEGGARVLWPVKHCFDDGVESLAAEIKQCQSTVACTTMF